MLKTTKVSIATLAISCLLVFIASFGIFGFQKKTDLQPQKNYVADCPVSMDQIRLKNYEFIEPLILTNVNTESNSFQELRNKIEQYVANVKNGQQADEVSVYFRRMTDGQWFSINPNQTYNPASMSKIIYLITYLKDAEYNPGVFSRKLFFSKHFADINQQNIKDFELRENSYYTIKDLLTYMIVYSDNDATVLLSQNMNLNIYNQLFQDLNITTPPLTGEYFISATDYSKFFRVLYNASYIRPDYSEYGLKLLTMSTYEKGLRLGVDSTVKIAHKFGERILGNKSQLHEFGIVFVKDNPYMIGVMSKGSSLTQLSDIIAEISRMTYTDYIAKYHI